MRVLVTGATGLIGPRTARALVAAGHEVTVLHRATSNLTRLEGLAITRVVGDVTDRDSVRRAVEGHDAVIHSAGVTSFYVCDRADVERVQVDGTRNVAEAARDAGVKRFVHTSSVAGIGVTRSGAVGDEDTPFWWPVTVPYMTTKRRGEEIVRATCANGGPHVVILCPATVLGAFGLNVSEAQLVTDVRDGKLPGALPGGYTVCDVDDVAAAHVAALTKGRDGARYVLGGHDVMFTELCAELAARFGVQAPTFKLPGALMRALSRIMWPIEMLGVRSSLGYASLSLATWCTFHSSARAIAELGYAPRPLAEILDRTADAYRQVAFPVTPSPSA
jgi:dihydroflavonol-4-reductase